MSLRAHQLQYIVRGKALLRDLTLNVPAGHLHVILGPNGAGKSTLLRLLAGDLAPNSGEILLSDQPLSGWSIADRARLRAVLPQRHELSFPFAAEEVVRLGRLAVGDDPSAVDAALHAADADALRYRRYTELSGGERARVQFARVLAQVWTPTPLGTRTLLLDEPTANLDLAHQHRCLRAARHFAATGVSVIAVLHDPNLAFAYADSVTLLSDGRIVAKGLPRDVLTAPILASVYDIPVEIRNGDTHPWVRVAVERLS